MNNCIKTLLLLFFAQLLLIPSKANGDLALRKSVPAFYIKNRTIDRSLKKDEAKLKLSFYTEKGIFRDTVYIGINDSSFNDAANPYGFVNTVTKSGYCKLYFYVAGYYEVIEDSVKLNSQEMVEAVITFQKADVMIMVDKPVIYVYTKEKTNMEIALDVNGKLGFTWPVYHESWKFTANPDGKIEMHGKEYNYLFWESEMPEYALDKNKNEGFLVATDTLLSFLENSLDEMGFSSVEAADFITFWYPQMIKNEKNHVQFLFNEACDTYAKLNISPQPDHIYRVGMVWSKAKNENIVLSPQIIPSIKRDGTFVIEWGGMEMETVFEY